MRFDKLLSTVAIMAGTTVILSAIPLQDWRRDNEYKTTIGLVADFRKASINVGGYHPEPFLWRWGTEFSAHRCSEKKVECNFNKSFFEQAPKKVIVPRILFDEKLNITELAEVVLGVDSNQGIKGNECLVLKAATSETGGFIVENKAGAPMLNIAADILVSGTSLYDCLYENYPKNNTDENYFVVKGELLERLIPKSLFKNRKLDGQLRLKRVPVTRETISIDSSKNEDGCDEIFRIDKDHSWLSISFESKFAGEEKFKGKEKNSIEISKIGGDFYVNHILKIVKFADINFSDIFIEGYSKLVDDKVRKLEVGPGEVRMVLTQEVKSKK